MNTYLLLHQYLFCIKQANKIRTLLSSHLLALIVIFGQMLLFNEGFIVLVSHPDTNPAGQGLTSVNFSITKLSDGSEGTLVVKRSCEGT